MPQPKTGTTASGAPMHFSVGALIEQEGKYLLIERAVPPPGFAGVAGHVDEGEDARTAAIREVKEEVGLDVRHPQLLFEEELDWNWCSKGVQSHYWYLFHCPAEGELARSVRETKSAAWYTKTEIAALPLEPAWEYWFKKLEVI